MLNATYRISAKYIFKITPVCGTETEVASQIAGCELQNNECGAEMYLAKVLKHIDPTKKFANYTVKWKR